MDSKPQGLEQKVKALEENKQSKIIGWFVSTGDFILAAIMGLLVLSLFLFTFLVGLCAALMLAFVVLTPRRGYFQQALGSVPGRG